MSTVRNDIDWFAEKVAANYRRYCKIGAISLFFLFLSFDSAAPKWSFPLGITGMTIAAFFLCNGTRYILKWIKINKKKT